MWYTDMHVGQRRQVQKQITQINGQVNLHEGQMQFMGERSPEHPTQTSEACALLCSQHTTSIQSTSDMHPEPETIRLLGKHIMS